MSTAKARYVMIGGFLGAGKTTCILRYAEWLTARGLRVGLVTNDQGGGLVDTALAQAHRMPVEEIVGGCFCCRFTSLVEAAENLVREKAPEVLIAEPVGSCTDLVATVSLPLEQIYGDRFTVAPMSVVVDPLRAHRGHVARRLRELRQPLHERLRRPLRQADQLAECHVRIARDGGVAIVERRVDEPDHRVDVGRREQGVRAAGHRIARLAGHPGHGPEGEDAGSRCGIGREAQHVLRVDLGGQELQSLDDLAVGIRRAQELEQSRFQIARDRVLVGSRTEEP